MPNMHSPMCIVYLQFILILSLVNYFGTYHLTSLLALVLCRVCSPSIFNSYRLKWFDCIPQGYTKCCFVYSEIKDTFDVVFESSLMLRHVEYKIKKTFVDSLNII